MQLTHHRHDHHHGEPTEGTPLTASDKNNVSGTALVHHMSLTREETPDADADADDFVEGKVHADAQAPLMMEIKMFLQKQTSRSCLALSALVVLVIL